MLRRQGGDILGREFGDYGIYGADTIVEMNLRPVRFLCLNSETASQHVCHAGRSTYYFITTIYEKRRERWAIFI